MALLTDKQLKKKYEVEFRRAPEKYYPTEAPSEMGYLRGQCASCGRFFWSTDPKRTVCGDSACVGGFCPGPKTIGWCGKSITAPRFRSPVKFIPAMVPRL